MVAFYNAKDRAIYDAGDKFVPQTKYLQNDYVPTEGISYAGDGSPVSYANSGIMTQYPIIYPPINQGGDGGGGDGPPSGPAVDNSQFDYETEAYGIDPSQGLTEEEQEALDNQIAGPTTSTLGNLGMIAGFMTAPFTTAINRYRTDKKKQKELEEKTRQAGIQADFQREAAKGNKGADFTGGRYDGADTKSGYDADPTGYSGSSRDGGIIGYGGKSGTPKYQQYFNGGRVGYFFGGRVNYKVGGRIGFKGGGGQIGGTADMSGGNIPGPGDTGGEGGNNPSDDSDTQFGGGNDNKQTSNPKTSIMDKIRYNPIINNPFTKLAGRIGLYTVNPTLLGLDYRTASQLKGVYDKATEDLDDEDVTMNKFANGGLASIL